jgi:hypothetical protein
VAKMDVSTMSRFEQGCGYPPVMASGALLPTVDRHSCRIKMLASAAFILGSLNSLSVQNECMAGPEPLQNVARLGPPA